MKECNICAIYNCRITKDFNRFRNGEVYFTPEEMQSSCSSYEPLPSLTVPLFIAAMYTNPQGVYDALENIKMKVIDDGRAPYFKIVSQFQRKKRRRRKKR